MLLGIGACASSKKSLKTLLNSKQLGNTVHFINLKNCISRSMQDKAGVMNLNEGVPREFPSATVGLDECFRYQNTIFISFSYFFY